MVVRRGEIWWAALPAPRGSEPGFRRPVLIVQSDAFNFSRIQTVLALVITSNRALARAPGNVPLAAKSSGLPKPSVVNVSQLITLDKEFLAQRVKMLPRADVALVEEGLRLVLAL